MIIGAATNASRYGFGLPSSSPIASKVPMIVEMMVEITATMRELPAALRIFGLAISLPYHSVENPVQVVGNPLLLKDSTISTRIGT